MQKKKEKLSNHSNKHLTDNIPTRLMHKTQPKYPQKDDADDLNDQRSPKVINNIFISNININHNLNINISIPPSIKSSRNNSQSIIDSFHSEISNLVKLSDHEDTS